MQAALASLVKGFGQLGDPAVIRVAAKSVCITLAVFAFGALGLWFALDALIRRFLPGIVPEAYTDATVTVIAVFLWLLGFWLLFRVVALAVLQFFADAIVAAVEARHYPQAALRATPLPFARDLANSARGLLRAVALNMIALPLLVLLWAVPLGAPALLLLVNALLLGRELTDMAWLRHASESAANPVPKAERFALGGAIAALMLVPVANLLAPVIGAAAGTHLTQDALARRARKEPSHG